MGPLIARSCSPLCLVWLRFRPCLVSALSSIDIRRRPCTIPLWKGTFSIHFLLDNIAYINARLALTLVDLPLTFFTSLIFGILIYFLVGLQMSAGQFL